MIYKMLPLNDGELQTFARIDDDGKCRLTCIAQHPQFKQDLANGVALSDAEGTTMTADQIKTFLETLP